MAWSRADRVVSELARMDSRLIGMGTTLTASLSVGTDLFIVHAGDSRAYLFRDGELEQLTTDHTYVHLLVQGGFLTPEAARHHRRRNVVTNIIGGPNQGVEAEVRKLQLQDDDVVLLCSDGLTEPVNDHAIAGVLGRYTSVDDAVRRLVDLALEGGGPDNITAVLAAFESVSDRSRPWRTDG